MTKKDAPTTTDGRAEFEAYLRKKWGGVPPTVPGTGEYADTASEDLWEAWQAARASSAAAQWLPIETAPTDGRVFLAVYGRQGDVMVLARWCPFHCCWKSGGSVLPGFSLNATGWCDLPAPPAKPADTGEASNG